MAVRKRVSALSKRTQPPDFMALSAVFRVDTKLKKVMQSYWVRYVRTILQPTVNGGSTWRMRRIWRMSGISSSISFQMTQTKITCL